jgi:hypothetical protein
MPVFYFLKYLFFISTPYEVGLVVLVSELILARWTLAPSQGLGSFVMQKRLKVAFFEGEPLTPAWAEGLILL